MNNHIKEYIEESIKTKELILKNPEIILEIERISKVIIETYKSGGKVLIAGNGGSAADARHIAGELVSKYMYDRPALNALALTENSSILTSIGNDYGYEYVFARQVQAFGKEGDILITISTSGNSENIIRAIEEAKNLGLKIIGLTGGKKSKMDNICDYIIKIPSKKTPIIQESQIMLGHIICALVENELIKLNAC